jgi:hypothetical protein
MPSSAEEIRAQYTFLQSGGQVRRVVGAVAAITLVLALRSAVGAAADLPQGSAQFDIASQLMLRLFGETSDSNASFAAVHGDRTSESPLRDLALQVGPPQAKPYLSSAPAAFAEDRLALRDLGANQSPYFGATSLLSTNRDEVRFAPYSLTENVAALTPQSEHFTADYQPVSPAPVISPEPGTLAFAPLEMRGPDFLPTTTTQIGALQFEGHDDGASAQTTQDALRDSSYGAGANFDVRAGKRNVNVNLSSEYEHVGRDDANTFSVSTLDSASSWQLPGADAPLAVPNYADMSRLSLGAGVSVPVVHDLTLNLNYDAQRLYGGYGLPGLMNLNTVNNSYGGKLTFNIPQISSSLSISAHQDRFEDSLLPINGSTQTREDVNFTVKF